MHSEPILVDFRSNEAIISHFVKYTLYLRPCFGPVAQLDRASAF